MKTRWAQLSLLQLVLIVSLCALLVGLWVTTNEIIAYPQADGVAFSTDNRFVAASYPMQGVYVWDLQSGRALRRTFGDTPYTDVLGFMSPSELVVIEWQPGGGWYVAVFDVATGRRTSAFPISSVPTDATLRGSTLALLYTSGFSTVGSRVDSLDLRSGQSLGTLLTVGGEAQMLHWSRDGSRVAALSIPMATSAPRTIDVWDVASQQVMTTVTDWNAGDAMLSADGKRLLCKESECWRVYDVDSGQKLSKWEPYGGRFFVLPDGQRVVGVQPERLQHRDASTGTLQREVRLSDPLEFTGGGGPACSPDGGLLAILDNDYLRIIDVPSLQCVHRIPINPDWTGILLYALAFLAWPVAWGVLRCRSHPIHNQPRHSNNVLRGLPIFIGATGIVYAVQFLFDPGRHTWLVLHWSTVRAAMFGELLLCVLCLSVGITRLLVSRWRVEPVDGESGDLSEG